MSILFVTRKWPPAVGGMEVYSQELVGSLRDLGHDVELVHLPGRADGRAPTALSLMWFGLTGFARLLVRRGRWDVIHGGDMAVWPLVLAARIGAGSRPALLLSAHGTDVSFANRSGMAARLYRLYLAASRLLLPGALGVIANSSATADHVRALGYHTVETVPLGCRVHVETPPTEDPTRLLFAARVLPRKGLSWFVREVLPRLPEPIGLDVAGVAWDAGEARALDHPRVTFLGPLPQPRLWQRMAASLAVVIPNIHSGTHQFEGFGLTAAEAAAAGGLVLASDIDGYRTSVIDGETGRLLPSEDGAAWVEAICALARLSPEARASQRVSVAEAARKAFDWTRVARDTVRVYRSAA